jgi:hypothetical protein
MATRMLGWRDERHPAAVLSVCSAGDFRLGNRVAPTLAERAPDENG